MKILVIGGGGMAGHMLVDYFERTRHEVRFTERAPGMKSGGIRLDAFDSAGVERVLREWKPDAVVNAAGLLNDNAERRKREAAFLNGYFPHRLAWYGREAGFRLVHISTDCVFSGKDGGYTEHAVPDGTGVYAASKFLGEVAEPEHVTIRTSIIGPELKESGIGLFHWFMRQRGQIRGYRQVFWSGVTTLELAKAVEWTLERPIGGLVHLTAPRKISKFDLLLEMKRVFRRDDVAIVPWDRVRSDKSLVNTRADFSYPVLPYPAMLRELKDWMDRSERAYPYLRPGREGDG